MSRVAITVK